MAFESMKYSRIARHNRVKVLIARRPLSSLGQGISEYGLTLALAAIVALGAFALLGNNLKLGFNSMLPKPPSPIASLPAGNQLDVSGHSSGTASQPNAAWERPLQITLKNGSQITIDGYPDNLSKSIMTVGANGTTTQLLATLEHLIGELLDKVEITEAQASALRTLANRGHDLANREKVIEDRLIDRQNGIPQTEGPVTYKGKTYGGLDTFARSIDILNSGLQKESQASFDDAYQQALNSAALQDPAVRAVVDSLVQDIAGIADVFGGETSAILTRPEAGHSLQNLLEATASKQTHQDSAEICTTDNGSDTGVHCQ
jgi:hypothetical protein